MYYSAEGGKPYNIMQSILILCKKRCTIPYMQAMGRASRGSTGQLKDTRLLSTVSFHFSCTSAAVSMR